MTQTTPWTGPSMPTDRFSCAEASLGLRESLAGTAVETTGWIAVEHAGPWSPKAPTALELGAAADALDHPGVRVQLVRPVRLAHVADQPGRVLSAPPTRTVLFGHAAPDPADRWLRRAQLPVDDIAGFDPAVTLSPTPPSFGEPVEDDVWLVCTHARRDACCALWGREAALALAAGDTEVWETTHTGGHRFAATAVVLPDGLALGRLHQHDVAAVAADLVDGRLDPALLRGRCALPRPAQAAEVALREHLGTHGRDAVRVVDAVTDDGDTTTVTMVADDGTWVAEVATRPVATARPVSDAADPTLPDEHVVLDLRAG